MPDTSDTKGYDDEHQGASLALGMGGKGDGRDVSGVYDLQAS